MPKYTDLCGWVNRPKDVEKILKTLPFPVFGDIAPIKGSGAKKQSLLHRLVIDVIGYYPEFNQTVGDCSAQALAGAATSLQAIEVKIDGNEEFGGIIASEPIYADGRVIIGQNQLGYSDGGIVAWNCKAVQQCGTLIRKNYVEQGIDLSKYDGNRARLWATPGKGTPSSLSSIAREHPVTTYSQITNYEQALDALASGYPIAFGAQFGVNQTRDKNGIAKRGENWPHAQYVIASDPLHPVPSLLVENSWGPNWISGPKRYEFDPNGSYWISADDFNYIASQGDCFAIAAYNGFPIRSLNLRIV